MTSIDFLDNMIDGQALECLTERALELLIPQIGKRMKFMKLLDELKSKTAKPLEAPTNILIEDEPDHQCTSAAVLAEQQGSPTPVPQGSRLVFTFIFLK